jgi:acetyl-CoA synthetase
MATGAYAGKFVAGEFADCLRDFGISNLAAAGTVYRLLMRDDQLGKLTSLDKATYTGEALSPDTLSALQEQLGIPVCGMYGTTETGVIIANYPGFADYDARPGALGKALPGWDVAVLGDDDRPVSPGIIGEISVRRRGDWFRSKDLARLDQDGYFWYVSRADDIIISAGWTISPIEVENTLYLHPDVVQAAVIGVPDPVRGQVLKAFIVSARGDDQLRSELQDLVRTRLSPHEYPRIVEFIDELPTTSIGKVNRHELRAREQGNYSPNG